MFKMMDPSTKVGSFGIWLFLRAFELCFVLGAVQVTRTVGLSSGWSLAFLGALGYNLIKMDSLVYGRADENGLWFRRYVTLRFVPWEKIQEVRGQDSRLGGYSIVLAAGPRWRRTLVFQRNEKTTVRASIRDRFGGNLSKPELIAWMAGKVASARKTQPPSGPSPCSTPGLEP